MINWNVYVATIQEYLNDPETRDDYKKAMNEHKD